jgi:hypothetical protein
MPSNESCMAKEIDGVPMCTVHGEKLVDRATAEATLGKLEKPSISSALLCPVSGAMFSFHTAAYEAIRDSGIELQ